MVKGSTPKFNFELPFVIPDGSTVRVIFAQKIDGETHVVCVKTGAEVEVDGNKVATGLNQSDTFLFDEKHQLALIQLRILTPSDEAIASEIIRVTVKECLECTVME